jgi:hypothetical protein
MTALAHATGRELHSALQNQCDAAALMEVFEHSAVAKVLCHGLVSAREQLVAFNLAEGGILPLADSQVAASETGRRHRFDWSEFRRLRHAPAVVFSAACSSGQSHSAGLGERLGLFSILRCAGTRALVAPRWDVRPEISLPILDAAIERHVRNGEGLGDALHCVCSEAAEHYPRWLAWPWAVEGDWQ